MSKVCNIKEFIYTIYHNYGCCEVSIAATHRQHSSLQCVAIKIVTPNFVTCYIFLPLRRVL